MEATEMLKKLRMMKKSVLKNKSNDMETKYQTITFMNEMEKLIKYQVPTPPIDVLEDGHEFRCPRCRTLFDTEDHVDDFNLCYICGQRFKEKENDRTE